MNLLCSLESRAGNDSLNGGAGVDTARFTGAKAEYDISVNALGVVTVSDGTAGRDGTDTLTGVEKLQFSDTTIDAPSANVTLQGMAYHWKSHVLLSGVKVSAVDAAAVRADVAPLMDLRGASFDAATGRLTLEVWANAGATAADNFDFTVVSEQMGSASFTLALSGGWSVFSNDEVAGQLIVRGFNGDASASGLAGATKIGVLQLELGAGLSDARIGLADVAVGEVTAQVSGKGVHVRSTGANGAYTIEALAPGDYSLKATRAATDSGNAITSADALAALRIAVGLNPNPDPDGTGPKTPPAVSPYQIMAADVNGSGTVTSADALAILRMAVKLSTALAQEWFFVEEKRDFWDKVNQKFTLSRTNASWDRTIMADPANGAVNLVGVLKGDVNGSWVAPAGSTDLDNLDPTYFQRLAEVIGVPNQDQWGGGP